MSDFQAYLVDERWRVAHSLDAECMGIGRDPANAIVVHDAAASRFQAEVRRAGDAFTLHVTGSTETKLNGHVVIGSHPLTEGDTIEVVYTRLRFTRNALPSDVMLAPQLKAVDRDFAEGKTEIREIISTKRLRQLRRPVQRPLWQLVLIMLMAAAVLAVLIRLGLS